MSIFRSYCIWGQKRKHKQGSGLLISHLKFMLFLIPLGNMIIKDLTPFVLSLLIVCVLATVAVFSWQILLKQKYDQAFRATRIGDSLTAVKDKFGKPSKSELCPRANAQLTPEKDLSTLFPNCKTRIWYFYALSYLDMGAWLIEFDDDDRVSGKDVLLSQ